MATLVIIICHLVIYHHGSIRSFNGKRFRNYSILENGVSIYVQQGCYGSTLHAVTKEHSRDESTVQSAISMLVPDVDASAEDGPSVFQMAIK